MSEHPQPARNDLLHVSDAAAIADVSASMIYYLTKNGRLNFTLKDGYKMLFKSEVEEYAQARRSVPTGVRGPTQPRKATNRHPTQLLEDKKDPIPISTPETLSVLGVRSIIHHLKTRITQVDEEIAVHSKQISELEATVAKLIQTQDTYRSTLAGLETISREKME